MKPNAPRDAPINASATFLKITHTIPTIIEPITQPLNTPHFAPEDKSESLLKKIEKKNRNTINAIIAGIKNIITEKTFKPNNAINIPRIIAAIAKMIPYSATN